MCGIAGILDLNRGEPWLRENVDAMTGALRHRGPDAGGIWTDAAAGIALGHRRLSIVDLSPLGAQPMVSPSGRYVISYNGEVYSFLDMRPELEAKGFKFRGGSDTEVMLAAIEAWGLDGALARFIGMFAFALWDRETRTLQLVRDRMGIKPVYWARAGSLFLFGSELKALLACREWQPELDRDALAAYTRWNYVPAPGCIYRGAGKLAPGSILTVRAGSEPTVRRFWDLRALASQWEETADDDETAADKLEVLLRDAVRRRMVADVPLGAFLSGGADSSLVVALMQSQSDKPVRSFTIGFHEREYNEATHAAAVAKHLGTDHTELYVSPQRALEVIPRLAQYYDEPFADSSQVPTFLVSEMTKQHVTVALSGDGGDELFAGYTRYHWADRVRRTFLSWPRPLRRAAAAGLSVPPRTFWEGVARLLPPGRRPQRIGERVAKLAAFLREDDADGVYRRQHTHWDNPEALVPGSHEPRGLPFDPSLRSDVPDFMRRMQLMDLLTYLPDDILTKVDRATMAVALEARVPLLDHRLVEHAWRLPQRMKIRGGTDKWLLRKVLYRYVPRELIERPKMGFSVPVGSWLRGPLRPWAEALLSESRLRDGGHFDVGHVRRAWTQFLAGRATNQEPLWGILMFEAWRDEYLGRATHGSTSA